MKSLSVNWREISLKFGVVLVFVIIFALSCLLWTYIVHEPSHCIICEVRGFNCTILPMAEGYHPTTECYNMHNATYLFMFFLKMAPYITNLVILLIFAFKIPQRIIFKMIPYAAFLDTILNFLLHILGQKGNDFTWVRENILEYYIFAVIIFLAICSVFYLAYWGDFQDTVKRLWGDIYHFLSKN